MLEYCAFPTLQALVAVGFMGIPRLQAKAQCSVQEGVRSRYMAIINYCRVPTPCLSQAGNMWILQGIDPLAVGDYKVLDTALREHVIVVEKGLLAPRPPRKPARMADYYAIPPIWR